MAQLKTTRAFFALTAVTQFNRLHNMASERMPNPEILEVRNIQPKTRQQREQTRDELEKARLKQRTGGFTRYVDADEVLVQPADSLAYATDADRFNRDTVAMEKKRRDEAITRKELKYYNRRLLNAAREEERWKAAEEECEQDEDAIRAANEKGLSWKRNAPSLPYNLISMKYHESAGGERLRFEDDKTRVRSSPLAPRRPCRPTSTHYSPYRAPIPLAVSGQPSSSASPFQGQRYRLQPTHGREGASCGDFGETSPGELQLVTSHQGFTSTRRSNGGIQTVPPAATSWTEPSGGPRESCSPG